MIYLLKNKYKGPETIKEYTESAEAKWNSKVTKLRCDNGREYVNNNLQGWCRRKGIVLDCTVPYTPQLNGKAERLNRTLLEKIRALLKESKLKKEMWGEVAYTATYLLNRSPTKTLTTTPYQKWNGKIPDLSNLKLFGCAAYSKVLGLKKLEDRSKEFVFIGYAPNGYRLWDSEKRKIVISRDVKFQDTLKQDTRDVKNTVNIKVNQIGEDSEESSSDEMEMEIEEINEPDVEVIEVEELFEEYADAKEEEEDDEDEEELARLRKSARTKKPPSRYGVCVFLIYEQAPIKKTGEKPFKWKKIR